MPVDMKIEKRAKNMLLMADGEKGDIGISEKMLLLKIGDYNRVVST